MWKSACVAAILVVSISLCVETLRKPSSVFAQQRGLPVSSGLVIHSVTATGGGQLMIMVEPSTRMMAVYHVDGASGKVSLRSVRNLQWDLLIENFNGGNPSPEEIRNMLNRP